MVWATVSLAEPMETETVDVVAAAQPVDTNIQDLNGDEFFLKKYYKAKYYHPIPVHYPVHYPVYHPVPIYRKKHFKG